MVSNCPSAALLLLLCDLDKSFASLGLHPQHCKIGSSSQGAGEEKPSCRSPAGVPRVLTRAEGKSQRQEDRESTQRDKERAQRKTDTFPPHPLEVGWPQRVEIKFANQRVSGAPVRQGEGGRETRIWSAGPGSCPCPVPVTALLSAFKLSLKIK